MLSVLDLDEFLAPALPRADSPPAPLKGALARLAAPAESGGVSVDASCQPVSHCPSPCLYSFQNVHYHPDASEARSCGEKLNPRQQRELKRPAHTQEPIMARVGFTWTTRANVTAEAGASFLSRNFSRDVAQSGSGKWMLDVSAVSAEPGKKFDQQVASVHMANCGTCKVTVASQCWHLRHLRFGALDGELCLSSDYSHEARRSARRSASSNRSRGRAPKLGPTNAALPALWSRQFAEELAGLRLSLSQRKRLPGAEGPPEGYAARPMPKPQPPGDGLRYLGPAIFI